jgi:hypothetical protein
MTEPKKEQPFNNGWPNEARWVGPNTKSKREPIVRTIITEEDMRQPDPLKQI